MLAFRPEQVISMGKRLQDTSTIDIAQILFGQWRAAGQQKSLEDFAQTCTAMLYKEFSDSIVLTRLFFTVPFKNIPETNRVWVENLAKKTGVDHLLGPEVPILSLISSAGQEAEWNDRRQSEDHVGIPLVSSSFIQNIPMMMRLIAQVTGGLEWLDTKDYNLQKRLMGRFSGTFFVPHALYEKDHRDRHIIASQGFVEKYDVKSVFGIGGGYEHGSFAVLLVFTRESLKKSTAISFLPAFNLFRSLTEQHAQSGTIFNDFSGEKADERLSA